MDDLSNLLISSGIGCFLDKVCFNHVFYADDLCHMTPCAIALQKLLNICHSYRITVDVNFNASKSFCVAFTPKPFKLRFPEININAALIPYTDSIRYLGFTFTNNHKDDSDMLRQMRMLCARSNRLFRLVHFCSRYVIIELGRSFCGSFYCSIFYGHTTTRHHSLKFELHTMTYIV